MEFIVEYCILLLFVKCVSYLFCTSTIYSKHTLTHICRGGFFRELVGDHFSARYCLKGTFSGMMEMIRVPRIPVLFSRFIIYIEAALCITVYLEWQLPQGDYII